MLPRRLQRLVDAIPRRDAQKADKLVEDYAQGIHALDLTRDAILAGNRGLRGLWVTITGIFTSQDTHVPSDRFLQAYTRFMKRETNRGDLR